MYVWVTFRWLFMTSDRPKHQVGRLLDIIYGFQSVRTNVSEIIYDLYNGVILGRHAGMTRHIKYMKTSITKIQIEF